MRQRAIPSLSQKLTLVSQIVFLAGVGLVGMATPWTAPTAVKASEASGSRVAVSSGTWRGASFPVENFQAYTSPFGYRGSPDGAPGQEFHRGLDMAAPEGSYIRNWWTGKVVGVSDDSACGTSVVIQSGEWEHVYCHMKGHV